MTRTADCKFDDVTTALLFLAIALAALMMPAQSDTWWLLRAGEDTWTMGRVVLRETYSHTVPGMPWPNHEWLSEVLFFAFYRIGGMPLLTIALASAVIAASAILWRLTPGPVRGKFLLMAFVLIPSSTAWTIRPQALTLFCLAVCLYLVAHRRLVFLPALMLVWANLHGGFVLGFVVIAGAVASALLADRQRVRTAIGTAAISAVATLATPLGVVLWSEIPASLARLRAYDVSEWRRPELFDPMMFPFWTLAVALVALSLWRIRDLRKFADASPRDSLAVCLAALGMLPLALRTGRNVSPFMFVAVPAVAALWPCSWWPASRRVHERPSLNLAIIAVATVAVVITVVGAYATPWGPLRWMPVPKQSLTALATCPGPLYNRYDEGGYLIWFARGRSVFIDSRQDPYPPALVREHIEVERTGSYRELFRRYAIACAFVDANSLVAQRLRADGWKNLYDDNQWAVLSR